MLSNQHNGVFRPTMVRKKREPKSKARVNPALRLGVDRAPPRLHLPPRILRLEPPLDRPARGLNVRRFFGATVARSTTAPGALVPQTRLT